jgi:hypothetical protein
MMSNEAPIDLESNETKTEAAAGKFETFDKLYRVDIQKYQRNKRGDYLPWSMSWALFKQHRPDAAYVFEADRHFPSGELETVCTVTSQGESLTMILPCLDNTMKPLKNPSRHAVNTCRMRCLTKCIAMFGLGLSCWNWVAIDEIEDFGGSVEPSEDEPSEDEPSEDEPSTANAKSKAPAESAKLEIKAEPEPPKAPEKKTIDALAKQIAAGNYTFVGSIKLLQSKGLVATPEQIKILDDAVPATGEAA